MQHKLVMKDPKYDLWYYETNLKDTTESLRLKKQINLWKSSKDGSFGSASACGSDDPSLNSSEGRDLIKYWF